MVLPALRLAQRRPGFHHLTPQWNSADRLWLATATWPLAESYLIIVISGTVDTIVSGVSFAFPTLRLTAMPLDRVTKQPRLVELHIGSAAPALVSPLWTLSPKRRRSLARASITIVTTSTVITIVSGIPSLPRLLNLAGSMSGMHYTTASLATV